MELDIRGIRLQNLLKLQSEYKRRCETMRVKPTDTAFYDYSGLNRSLGAQLKAGDRSIGHKVARKIETAWQLPPGYMDTLHNEPIPTCPEVLELFKYVNGLFADLSPQERRQFAEVVRAIGSFAGKDTA